MQRIGTYRRKTRAKLKKHPSAKGKISVSRYFAKYEVGDEVALKAEPAIQKGMYCPRFYGKIGIVVGNRGRCCEVLIKDFKKDKVLIVHPIHLARIVEK
jgi:large subunit ribosomal protein L21e